MAYATVNIRITGYVVGPIWMPCGEACKPFSYEAHKGPFRDGDLDDTLRDHLLRITNDGDFQHCEAADAIVTITRRSDVTGATRSRSWPLEAFPSIADMVRRDWDGPVCFEDECEDA